MTITLSPPHHTYTGRPQEPRNLGGRFSFVLRQILLRSPGLLSSLVVFWDETQVLTPWKKSLLVSHVAQQGQRGWGLRGTECVAPRYTGVPRNKEGFQEKTHPPLLLLQLHGTSPRPFWKKTKLWETCLMPPPYPSHRTLVFVRESLGSHAWVPVP